VEGMVVDTKATSTAVRMLCLSCLWDKVAMSLWIPVEWLGGDRCGVSRPLLEHGMDLDGDALALTADDEWMAS